MELASVLTGAGGTDFEEETGEFSVAVDVESSTEEVGTGAGEVTAVVGAGAVSVETDDL